MLKEFLQIVLLENANLERKKGLLKDRGRRRSKQLSVALEDEMVKFEGRDQEIRKALEGFRKIHKLSHDYVKKKIYFKE